MDPDTHEELERIAEEIRQCTRCPLHRTRTNAVPGEGGFAKGIMFIGEAPGRNEDLQGKPFVGKAGQLLNELLDSIGLSRDDVYITNIVKCRPPNNRDPAPEEVKACSPFLERQIQVLGPRIIVTLGRHAWKWVCEHFGVPHESISKAHGNIYRTNTLFYGVITVMPMYHPAAAIYNRELLPVLTQDFLRLKEFLKK
ncbi:MAG: uracil-DNA glycosylase [Candidatus Diapherotrites archaeon]|nr:uracil-DNA glycosylase [Candidatus Diapherotrites archaeon]MDN5366738.1 uracil-DNA glycosylase [Candidatus Diapherotrites archaeon]